MGGAPGVGALELLLARVCRVLCAVKLKGQVQRTNRSYIFLSFGLTRVLVVRIFLKKVPSRERHVFFGKTPFLTQKVLLFSRTRKNKGLFDL